MWTIIAESFCCARTHDKTTWHTWRSTARKNALSICRACLRTRRHCDDTLQTQYIRSYRRATCRRKRAMSYSASGSGSGSSSSHRATQKRKSAAEQRAQDNRPIEDVQFYDIHIEAFDDLLRTHVPKCSEPHKLLDYLGKCYAFLNAQPTARILAQQESLRMLLASWDAFVFQYTAQLLEPINIRGRKNWNMLMYFWLCSSLVHARLAATTTTAAELYAHVLLDELAWIDLHRVDSYTQLELCHALWVLLKNWRRVRWSTDLVGYVDRLMLRCAVLIAGPRSPDDATCVHNHKQYRSYDVGTKTYGCNDEFVFQTSVWFARMRGALYSKCIADVPRIAEHNIGLELSASAVKHAREWILSKADGCQSSEFMKQFREIYMEFLVAPGETEKHARDQHGEVSTSGQIVNETRHQRQIEYIELRFLRNVKPRALLEQRERHNTPGRGAWSFLDCMLSLKVIDSHFQNRFKVPWIKKFLLPQQRYYELELSVSLQQYPVIFENLNDFDVLYKRTIYETKRVEAALVMWATIIKRDFSSLIDGRNIQKVLNEILLPPPPPLPQDDDMPSQSMAFEEEEDDDNNPVDRMMVDF